ncbi:SPW repeat domain-containing protein [Streptomyces sp. NPDC054840]
MTVSTVRTRPPSGSPPPPALRKAQHDQLIGGLMLLIGLVLCAVPMAQQDGAKDAQVNEAIIGTIVVFAAGSRVYRGAGVRSDLIVAVAGAWLLASPWLLSLGRTSVYGGNKAYDVALGSALVILALIGLVLLRGRPARKTRAASSVTRGQGRR